MKNWTLVPAEKIQECFENPLFSSLKINIECGEFPFHTWVSDKEVEALKFEKSLTSRKSGVETIVLLDSEFRYPDEKYAGTRTSTVISIDIEKAYMSVFYKLEWHGGLIQAFSAEGSIKLEKRERAKEWKFKTVINLDLCISFSEKIDPILMGEGSAFL